MPGIGSGLQLKYSSMLELHPFMSILTVFDLDYYEQTQVPFVLLVVNPGAADAASCRNANRDFDK